MEIKIGKKLTLILPRKLAEDPNFKPVTQFEGGDDTLFLVTAPVHRGAYFPLHNGEECIFQFNEENGIFSFTAEPQGRVKVKELYFYKMKRTSEIERIQRREDFRIKMKSMGKIEYELEQEGKEPKKIFKRVLTLDLSGGGTAFLCNELFSTGDKLTIHFDILDEQRSIGGTVSWVVPLHQTDMVTDEWKYRVGAKFNFPSNRQKEEMIKYIFKLQTILRKRERDKM